jgi:2-oxoacid:acceptor oxidoreductase gamma subunit (pyruvate/2-ketoisovalerate family)
LIELRLHGRGGQGTVIATKILAEALSAEGKFVQAFPEYGVERRGAPVRAFLRISDNTVYERSKIYKPNHIVILDPSLIGFIELTDGLKKGGWIIVNTSRNPEELDFYKKFNVATVPAREIAVKYHLGSESTPIVNTAILGGVIKILKLCSLESLLSAVKEGVPRKKEENVKAAKESYERTRAQKIGEKIR